MAIYPNDFKDYLKSIAPLHDVIQAILGNVLPSGANYITNCPFHDDNNPSLMIKPETNTWFCHGCGAGSKTHSRARATDVYGFVMGYYNISLGEAIEWLARFLNVPLPALDPETQQKLNKLSWWYQKCETAKKRFQENLLNHKDAYKYLRNRGLEDLEILTFGLGFGDDQDQEFLNTKGKITFPIHDYNGNIVSFTGRVPFGASALAELNRIQKEKGDRITPKYDNRWPLNNKYVDQSYIDQHPFPEFDRNKYLYGIYHAKNYIMEWKRAILVEGFTDVIMLHRYGVLNSVSTMGTNLSDEQASQIKRSGAKRVLLMRDGDEAGIKAMEKDAVILQNHDLIVEVCPLPEGHDPDSLCQTFQLLDDSLSKYINNRTRSLTQWKVEKVYREQQDEILYHYSKIGEIQFDRMEKVVQLLAKVEDPIELDILGRQYAELFVVSYESLLNQVKNYQLTMMNKNNKIKER